MQVVGVHHVSIHVDDVEVSTAFYVGRLGLHLRADRPAFGFGGAWLDAGGQPVPLIEASVPTDHGQHFALRVADLDATVEELRAAGVGVSEPSPVGSGRQAFLRDPAGNLVELHQPAGGSAGQEVEHLGKRRAIL